MDVRDVMLSDVPAVTVDASLREIAELLVERDASAVLVVAEDGEVLGMVTEAVLARAVSRMVDAGEPARAPAATSLRRAS